MLFLSESLQAQNNIGFSAPDNEPSPLITKTQSSMKSLSQETGKRSSAANLTSECKAVETGNSAAFSTTLIKYKSIHIPVEVKASWMPFAPDFPNATINGIDSDGDCVRDDIERHIGMLFKNKNLKRKRKYIFEYAKWLGIFIKINHWSIETSRDIANEQYKAATCIKLLNGDKIEVTKMIDRLFSNFHNTFARSERYIRNTKRLGGWNTREEINVSCP